MNSIAEIRKTYLPDCRDVMFTQVDLDINDLGIADILRNINKLYPINSRKNQYIRNGDLALIVKCKSEYLSPMEGLVLIISDDKVLNITARNHIVAVISVDRLSNEADIIDVTKGFLSYILSEYKNSLDDIKTFCVKYMYDIDMEDNEL